MAQLMQQAGVDFAILGGEECCTGDPARRMGEELLFKQQAETNVENARSVQIYSARDYLRPLLQFTPKRICTVWRQSGHRLSSRASHRVLAQLVHDKKLIPVTPVTQKVAYHDPCYIGRYNDIYDAPRELLSSIPGIELVEAPDRNRQRATCCGGGGGNVWMEGWGDKKATSSGSNNSVPKTPIPSQWLALFVW
jgi:Fe-S oxidoreductase